LRVSDYRIIFQETEAEIVVTRIAQETAMVSRTLTTPKGEELVVPSREEYEDLLDARDHALAMAAHARGDDPGLTDAELDEYLLAPTPLAYWRKRRGVKQSVLAEAAGISQPYLAQLESGRRTSANIAVYTRLAKRLAVRIEDFVAQGEQSRVYSLRIA
jgi:DNA-binding XRE family transcriptional regulator